MSNEKKINTKCVLINFITLIGKRTNCMIISTYSKIALIKFKCVLHQTMGPKREVYKGRFINRKLTREIRKKMILNQVLTA